MSYTDLRDWLEAVESHGELKRIGGADWNLEMSGITEVVQRKGKGPMPAILFDDIPGYPKGYQALFALLSSTWRIAKTLGLPEDQIEQMSVVHNWRKKLKDLSLIPPKFVSSGPIEENVDTGDQIDILKFPSPLFHELDRNRYIGTGCAIIQKDPDEGWVNVGTYRVQVDDHGHLTLHIVEGQHGSIIMNEKYFARGQAMPVAIAIGVDPALWWASSQPGVPWGTPEYDYAGGIKGEPIEVIEGSYTGLPLPAHAEIVIEGECHPGEVADEGPFGEWHGYYANLGLSPVPEPVIRVKAVHYRNNPILTCSSPGVPPHDVSLAHAICSTVGLWNRLEVGWGMPGIKGVWCYEFGCGVLFHVVSVEQLYSGHSRQVGLLASQYPFEVSRYTIVVDDDIDPSNLEEVMWAVVTRVMPDQSIQILPHCHTSSPDPAVSPEEKRKYKMTPKPLESSKVVIDACRPLSWKNEWYPIARISPDLTAKILEKWQAEIADYL